MPQQQPGWGQQPAWAPPAPRAQSSSARPFLVILLVVLLIGLGGLVYWQFGDAIKGFLASAGGTTPATDTTPPTISTVKATPHIASAIITWKTNEPASSQVEYGLNTTYGSVAPAQPQNDPSTGQSLGVVDHSVTLGGTSSPLQQGITYHYRVKSKDKAGNEAVSGDATFTTLTAEE
jgi:hypothetical protein